MVSIHIAMPNTAKNYYLIAMGLFTLAHQRGVDATEVFEAITVRREMTRANVRSLVHAAYGDSILDIDAALHVIYHVQCEASDFFRQVAKRRAVQDQKVTEATAVALLAKKYPQPAIQSLLAAYNQKPSNETLTAFLLGYFTTSGSADVPGQLAMLKVGLATARLREVLTDMDSFLQKSAAAAATAAPSE